ncbi:hypothetical protein KUTeg_009545 [Tegillarca granosa]|uniref:Uncharacterized protein n=1 Tax=Tegillarca granosa TaxID=220873 RepID=A0ABQ9F459_TEGGR|nr:hypothetical protein KUTeg_009545 [Tegillarca granosa]
MDWLLTRLEEESEGEDADNEDEDFRGGYFVDTSNFDMVITTVSDMYFMGFLLQKIFKFKF